MIETDDNMMVLKSVLELEGNALLKSAQKIDKNSVDETQKIFEMIRQIGGSLVFCGVGKSGLIGMKLASTFSSLGLSSSFLHPVEALHGDLGRLNANDVIVFISKSGSTEEILKLIPFLPMDSSKRIGLLGNIDSIIAKDCKVVFDCSVEKEACINNQAPTTSSTLALAMGDALAVMYETMVDLSEKGFAINHPGGILGKTMLLQVKDLMWEKPDCPVVRETSTLLDVVLKMTRKPVGGCAVVSDNGELLGIVVEGDFRRTFTNNNQGLDTSILKIMNTDPIKIDPFSLAYDALLLMEKRQRPIDILPVIDEKNIFHGFLRLHDLLREGFSTLK